MSGQVKENVIMCDYSSQLTNIPFVEIQPAGEKLGSISFTWCSLWDIWHRQTCWDIIGKKLHCQLYVFLIEKSTS